MDRAFFRSAAFTVLACAAIALLGRSEPKASYNAPGLWFHQRVIRMMHDRNLNKNASAEEIAGYYEGLLAGRPVQMLERSRQSEQWRFRGDYLYYEAKPHLDIADYNHDPTLRHVTNSFGMPDVEYPQQKPANTRRLAVLGDSITRGKGARFGETYDALFENYLNEHPDNPTRFEVLNFSDNGYRLTQLVDVALEKVQGFDPDVYVLCLTQLAVNRKWGDHIGQLVWDRIDLKYPFLKDLATTARLDSRDPPSTMDAKLAVHRLPAIRWALTTLRDHAKRQGTVLVVILVPAAADADDQRQVFAGPLEILGELEIVTINLLDTFNGTDDFAALRVIEGDVHPNGAGHRRIFESLKRQVGADRTIATALLGPEPDRISLR
jgi:lysophospholipase L1-like esterase